MAGKGVILPRNPEGGGLRRGPGKVAAGLVLGDFAFGAAAGYSAVGKNGAGGEGVNYREAVSRAVSAAVREYYRSLKGAGPEGEYVGVLLEGYLSRFRRIVWAAERPGEIGPELPFVDVPEELKKLVEKGAR